MSSRPVPPDHSVAGHAERLIRWLFDHLVMRPVEYLIAHPRVSTPLLLVVALAYAAVMPGWWGYGAVLAAATLFGFAYVMPNDEPVPEFAGVLARPDPLGTVTGPTRRDMPPMPGPVEALTSIKVGRTQPPVDDNGDPVGPAQPWYVRLWQTHWLLVAVTRGGKSGLLWAMIHGLAPWIRHGEVCLLGADPKQGAELGKAERLFTRLEVCDEPLDFAHPEKSLRGKGVADMLEEMVKTMDARNVYLRKMGQRVHRPTTKEPLFIVAIDEVMQVVTVPNKAIRDRITFCIEWLLRQGASAGIVVIAATQDPRMEKLGWRALVPSRWCGRVAERTVPDMALGTGARELGALCDRIPESTPGVGFYWLDGDPAPVRVRADWVTDEELDNLNRDYACPAWRDAHPEAA